MTEDIYNEKETTILFTYFRLILQCDMESILMSDVKYEIPRNTIQNRLKLHEFDILERKHNTILLRKKGFVPFKRPCPGFRWQITQRKQYKSINITKLSRMMLKTILRDCDHVQFQSMVKDAMKFAPILIEAKKKSLFKEDTRNVYEYMKDIDEYGIHLCGFNSYADDERDAFKDILYDKLALDLIAEK